MDLNDTPEQAAYRERVRAWVAEHRDESPPPVKGLHVDDPAPYRRWQRRLAEARLVGVTWPKEYGGGGLGPAEELIVNDELAKAGCASIVDHIAIGELGPTIIAHGTEEQKQRYIAPMLHGDEGWCQLFSEPAAGSDLAGIQARARRRERSAPQGEGGTWLGPPAPDAKRRSRRIDSGPSAKPVDGGKDGGWRISGQKVWTTMAQFADFGLMLARTNPDLPKHRGLTMLIVPMAAPGVTVRPLRLMSGPAPFNEIFFDDVELDDDALVGPVDGGWGVAMTTLMYERLMALAAFQHLAPAPEVLLAPLAHHPALADGYVRRRIAELAVDRLALQYTAFRALSALSRGQIPGPEAGLGKIGVIEAGRKAAELIAEVLGPEALEGEWGELAAEMPGMRSAGGTEEILRNTIGERVLGLPPEPRFDKDVPFSELGARPQRAEVTS